VLLRSNLPNVRAHDAVTSAYAAVSAVQDMTPARQVAGVALLFVAMCEVAGLDPSQLINASKRRLATEDDDYTHTEVAGLRAYIKEEIAK
jgi:hypothetical protein